MIHSLSEKAADSVADRFSYRQVLSQELIISAAAQNQAQFSSYQENKKNITDTIITLMGKQLTVSEFEKIIEFAKLKIKESVGFDMSVGSELDF